mgnify:CR=1 FL=1
MAGRNPFTDFKNRYAGEGGKLEILTAEASKEMGKAYQQAYARLMTLLVVSKKTVKYGTYAYQSQLLKHVARELSSLKRDAGKVLNAALKRIAKYATDVAIADLEAVGSDLTKAENWHYDYNMKYVQQVFADSFKHIAAQTDKMAASVKDDLRNDAMKVFRRAAVEGLTRRQAYQALRGEMLERDPEFSFVDKKGRKIDASQYFDMLTKTVMASSWNECYANTLVNEGQDLVKVSPNGATDECRRWEGKVLSLTGATPGYTTVDEARATKEVFHPRCKHRLVAYHKDLEDIFKAVEDGKSDKEILEPNPKLKR